MCAVQGDNPPVQDREVVVVRCGVDTLEAPGCAHSTDDRALNFCGNGYDLATVTLTLAKIRWLVSGMRSLLHSQAHSPASVPTSTATAATWQPVRLAAVAHTRAIWGTIVNDACTAAIDAQISRQRYHDIALQLAVHRQQYSKPHQPSQLRP